MGTRAAPRPNFPDTTQHIAISGRTGTGKTVAALDMLSRRLHLQPALIVDHKKDDKIAQLPAERLSLTARFLPDRGLHVVRPRMRGQDADELDDLLLRLFERKHWTIYVDEGHLMGKNSPAVRDIMVAGRSRHVCMMWCSQRAAHIDPFIWSQSSFYRAFDQQNSLDVKRFNENFPIKWFKPEPFHSHYYDGTTGTAYYLSPSAGFEETKKRLDTGKMQAYRVI